MADNSYQPKTYHKRPGDVLVIADGGELAVESGGALTVETGGELAVESGGVATVETGAELAVESGGTITIEAGAKLLMEDGTAAGAGLSPLIWADCPRIQMLVDPTLGLFIGDDFPVVQATGFPYKIVGTNGTFLSLAGTPYGVAQLDAPGTNNDECYVSYNNNLAGLIKADATKNWWFEARVKISQITLSQGIFVGFAEETAVADDFMTDHTMAIKVTDYLGFQIITATDIAAIWQTVHCIILGTHTVVTAAAGTAAAAWVKLGMKCVSGTVTFYVDGVAVADLVLSSAAEYPLDQIMCPTFANKVGQGTQNTMDVDWWYVAQLR